MNRTAFLHFFSFIALSLGFSQSSFAQCEAISGSVTTAAGESLIYTCPGDGNDDVIQFIHEGTNDDLGFQYVVTDSEFNVIGLPPSGEVNFEGAGEGICYVLGFNFEGNILLRPGDPVFTTRFSDGCYQITRRKVEVRRAVPDGGTVAMPSGATERTVCTTDGYDNVVRFTRQTSSNAAYRYVITDDQNNILGLPPSDNLNFEGVFPGVCRVWGLSFTGNITAQMGDNAAEVALSDGCFDLSDNFITVVRTDVDGGTVSTVDGETSITTVPSDGIDDIFEFAHVSESDAEFIYVVTDEENTIIGTPPGNMVNFEGAGEGICRVWGVSFTGDLRFLQGGTLGNFALSSDCFEISENFVEVVRSAEGACNVSGGMITLDGGATETSICVDGVGDPLNVTVEGSNGESAAWVITDDQLNILALPPAPPFDLDGAGPGVCLIWYLRFDGEISGAEVGANAADLAGCFSLSNPISVSREVPDGGMVSLAEGGTEFVGTAGDIVIEVTHTTTAPSLSYWYIITDGSDNILAWLNSAEGNTLDLSGAPAGTCHVWGWNYRGLDDPIVGENISTLTDDSCEDISDNFITVIREDPNCNVSGGMITLDGGATETFICVDGIGDPLNVTVEGSNGENAAWVITDDALNILALPPAPPFDLDGAGPGTCLIWYLRFDGEISGAEVGANAAALEGCFDLSNPITVVREELDGGTVAMPSGATVRYTCANDGEADVIMFTTTSEDANYQYVITDEAGNILGLPPGNSLDFEPAGTGVCLVWGLSFTGEITAQMGDNALEVALSDGCFELSENFITVNRDEPNGGIVTTADGETSIEVTVGDGEADVIAFAHTEASNSLFTYVVTDEEGIILGLPPANRVDFEGAGPGTCLVWGLAYTGEVTAQLGDNALEVALTDGCFDLSDEAVSVVRVMGGQNLNINPNIQTRASFVADMSVSPNPIEANFNVQFNVSETTTAQLSIYNIYGQLVETRSVEAAAGFNQYDLDGSRFVNGNYIVELRTADAAYKVSVVKQ
ncbi:MAG: T9SS type A sorting domain-containing protein [Bacteroidota bacterium]